MKHFLYMLVILNPFAQVLYLSELMHRLSPPEFARVHARASVLSFGVFALFAVGGDLLLQKVFQVRLASLQIFGGLIILYIAQRYFTQGAASNLLFRGDITDLAPQISLPYMVGPGTIWVSMIVGRNYAMPIALGMIAGVLLVNGVCLIAVRLLFSRLGAHRESLVGKYFGILVRTNTLFVGAIAVEMILTGLETVVPGMGNATQSTGTG